MRIYSFHGGIHPPENKKQSTRADIGRAPLPKYLILPTQQHIGLAADPVVKVGDRVLKGQLIAEPVGRISSAIHAPSSGTVVEISPQPVPHASGLEEECIVIETDGEERWIDHQGLADYRSLERAELVAYIRSKGISGMGGAGFPTDVKLNLGSDHIVNTLIINAAECEPYITADDMLMREHADEVIRGIEIIAHLLRPSHVLIGTEDNKPNAIRALTEAIKTSELDIDLRVVPTKYPSGGERQLIKLLTDVEIPSGRIPADVGIVVQNVGTTAAIYRAVAFGEPLIERIVTVTGDALRHPQNLYTLIGTPFRTLLEHCDLRDDYLSRLVMGGPMMGVTVSDQQIPVIKTTNCIIAATAEEMPPAPPAQPCIRCGMCEQACPAQLLPQQLYWFARGKEFDKAKNHNLFDCIECGACAYVCPSSIPLVQYYRFAKSEIRAEELEQRKADHARQRFEARKARQEREAADKEAKRKARAAEAAAAQAQRKASESSDNEEPAKVDSAALKTAAAVARTKLKKAEKAYAMAVESGADSSELATLQSELDSARQKAEAAQAQLEGASAPGTASSGDDAIKPLKTAAAVARTKLRKAEDALKNAREKNLPGIEKLEATVQSLQSKVEQAQQALESAQAESGGADSVNAQPVDLKALKQQVSIMRTKLKKAEAALETAEDPQAAQAEIDSLRQRFNTATEQLNAAEQVLLDQAAARGIDLKKLRIDAAMAKAAVTKLERALTKLEDDSERTAAQTELSEARASAASLAEQLAEFE